jgi:hypothetical protein
MRTLRSNASGAIVSTVKRAIVCCFGTSAAILGIRPAWARKSLNPEVPNDRSTDSWFIFPLALLSCAAAISLGSSQAADVPKELTMPEGGRGAATNLTANRYDDPAQPARALVKLQWTPASQQGSEQRIVVTIFSDGFRRGAFDVSSPLSSNQTSLVWDKLQGEAIHHWKVLTLQPSGWVLSQTGTFEGPTVIRDHIDRSDRR